VAKRPGMRVVLALAERLEYPFAPRPNPAADRHHRPARRPPWQPPVAPYIQGMHAATLVLMALLAVVALVAAVAPRLKVPPPILLVIAGLLVSAVPGVPRLPLDPDLILLVFLPPLLYADAFRTSWTDFRRWLRPIVMLATGLVAATTLVVGLVAKWCFPELSWPACFILGAVVSPTDTVAAQAVIERLHVPRRVTAILGGESLVNDATGLVGVQIGVAVALSGVFTWGGTMMTFSRVAGLGVVVGVIIGLLFAELNRRLTDTAALFTVSLLAPYAAFLAAHHLDASGVLAVVVAGFIVSWRIHQVAAASRVPLFNAWDLLSFVLNGFCFVFIGLETPHLLAIIAGGGWWLLGGAGLVAAAIILTRIAWCFPAAYLPLRLSARLRAREGGYPSWRGVLLLSWCGMRGVVSLAAALALPHTLADGTPFPGRDLLVFCTVVVIAATLLAQGLTLQPLIALLGIRSDGEGEAELRTARETMLQAGIARLDAYCTDVACPVAVHHFRQAMVDQLQALQERDASERDLAGKRLAVSQEVHAAVRTAQADELLRLRDRNVITDNTYLALQLELDRLA
jgi:Na+/H+ antiporter